MKVMGAHYTFSFLSLHANDAYATYSLRHVWSLDKVGFRTFI